MKILRVLLLVLTLSVCAYAGDMPNLGPSAPPPAQAAGDMDNGVAGNMDNGISADSQTTETTITDIAFSLIQSVLSIF